MTALVLDGIGLDPHSQRLIRAHGGTVHARVGAVSEPRSVACGYGLGAWWTGVAAEVTCSACRRIALAKAGR